ncbi:MAG TPA: ankyrin repeat domain-containing protein [Coxiellaceae bacterium]|nr:ankyrin repeat domain-containing protein [Coxiellaceae bacterium]
MDLIDAILNRDIEQLKKLLAAGANPNGHDDKAAIRPLHFAAQQNVLEAIPLLMEAGAKLEASTSPEGDTPLKIAQIHGHVQMVGLLASYLQKDFLAKKQ